MKKKHFLIKKRLELKVLSYWNLNAEITGEAGYKTSLKYYHIGI